MCIDKPIELKPVKYQKNNLFLNTILNSLNLYSILSNKYALNPTKLTNNAKNDLKSKNVEIYTRYMKQIMYLKSIV